MPRYRTLNNDAQINVDRVALLADSDGAFTVASGSRAEAVLIAGGAVRVDAQPLFPDSVSGAGNRALMAAIGDSLEAMTHQLLTVTAASRSGNILTLTTSGAHGMYAGARGRFDGLDAFDSSMRGRYTVLSVPTTTTLTVPNVGPDSASLPLGTTPRFANLQRRANDGFLTWFLILSKKLFDLGEIFATPGRRTADMAQFVPAVIASGAGFCAVLGGTNDIHLDSLTAAQITPNLQKIYTDLLAGGVRPICVTIPPPIGTAWTTARAQSAAQVNAWIRNFCRLNSKAILADIAAAIIDGTNNASPGTAKTGYIISNDVHWTQKGAYYAGKRMAADVSAAVVGSDRRVVTGADTYGFDTTSSNILDAGPWAASGGTVSAPVTCTMAAGLVAERLGSATAVASTAARADGCGYDAVLVVTPTAANDGGNIRTAGGAIHPRIVAGQTYAPDATVSTSGVAGSSLVYSYQYLNGTVDGTTINYISCPLYPSEATPIDEDWSGVFDYPPFTINGVITSAGIYSTLMFSAAGSAVTQKTGRMSIRPPTA
ncbi:hypothetical protein DBR47_14395 [Paucibacter sp. KBW04]|uniref:GDSL-type esterase/lipase family protein n=1 Tax=Paucibacter sp. KBW04 TaxID=2153361 RepID=UPI000F57FBD5|nr:hypothetical protein [Paucibacter sp. KBW04]RQO57978.1 hypothetical protein DBR47_14395 [Paucibacter sp. KBW04]